MRSLARIAACAVLLAATFGCDDGSDSPMEPGPEPATALFLVEDPAALNASEVGIVDRLEDLGFTVTTLADQGFAAPLAEGFALVVISKTISSSNIGSKLRNFGGGIVFWEDNLQQLSMFSTISNDGSEGTIWHDRGTQIRVLDTAPAELRAGLSGVIEFYTTREEIVVAPAAEIVSSAVVVAEIPETGNKAIYVLEPGSVLADGSVTGGRRVLFGLYNDSFRILTPDGRALFDAAIEWAAGRS